MKKYLFLFIAALFSVSCIYTANEFDFKADNVLYVNDVSNVAGGFISLGSTWAKQQTEVSVRASEDKLSFEFRCFGDVDKTVFSGKKADDDMTLFGGDHIELQIAPDWKKDKTYMHFAVNPAKSFYHAVGQDKSWTPKKFDCSVSVQNDCRIITLEFPWTTLGVDKMPEAGTVWKVNFCRGVKMKGSGIEFSSWTGAASYHDINQMGELVFGRKSAYGSVRIFKCAIENGDFLVCKAAAMKKSSCTLQILLNGELCSEKKMSDTVRVDFADKIKNRYIPLKSADKITLRLVANKNIVWEKSAYGAVGGKDFMLPDKFEYLKDSQMRCSFAAPSGKIVIRNDEKVFAEYEVAAKSASVSLKGIPAGRYVVQYSSNGNYSTRVIFIRDAQIASFAPMEKNAVLAAKGEQLFFDGKPFYLLGISGGSKTHYPAPAAFTLRYGAGSRKNAPVYQGLPGKKLVRKPYTGYAFNYEWQKEIGKHLAKQSKSVVNAWRTIAYEANLPVFFMQKDGELISVKDGSKVYGEIYAMAKKAMPDKLFSVHVDNMASLSDYVKYCDIMEFSSWRSSYHSSDMLLYQGEDFDFVRRHLGNKPIVMWLGGSIPNRRCRSAEEIRGALYHTIIKGGAGNIIHMGHGGIPSDRSRFWSMLSMLSREIDTFYSDLINGKPYSVKLPSVFAGKAVITADNELLLVVLNKTNTVQKLTAEHLPYSHKTFEFTPYEPRVFRFQCNAL